MDDGQVPFWRANNESDVSATQPATAPRGLLIAVLGPDGAGKSTLIDHLQRELTGLFGGTYCQHVRPRLFGRRDDPNPLPHANRRRGWFKSLLKLLYLVADFRFGYWVRTRPALLRSTTCMSDRYYQDLFVDPLRYGYTAPMWCVRALEALVPPPDLIFILTAPAAVVRSRKDEVSVEECERQLHAYRALADRYPQATLVDGTRPPWALAHQARQLISRHIHGNR